jgi:hypothetical protein
MASFQIFIGKASDQLGSTLALVDDYPEKPQRQAICHPSVTKKESFPTLALGGQKF